jgi:hypothetical protein
LNKRRTPDDPAQSKRFLEAAREAGADETEEGADRAFRAAVSKPAKPQNGNAAPVKGRRSNKDGVLPD